ncbi:MAG: ADP-ribosylglycohydrolase family protein, partial [Deltaproteobacteria bacterium]|nr:ADP-ribosylglycohydrolase family protein [Deltaproteobacteria bacterium]
MADRTSKFLGCMIGSALGDAIGEIAFVHFREKSLNDFLEGGEPLIYTDDTAMALGIAESLVRKKRIDQRDLGNTFRRNFENEPWRGYGSGPPVIFSMVKKTGISYVEAAKSLFGGRGSIGNGAAMRIAPVGLFYHSSRNLYESARLSAEVTHAHPLGIDGAAIQAAAVAEAVNLNAARIFPKEKFIGRLIDMARTDVMKEKMAVVRDLVNDNGSPEEAAHSIGRTVAVYESMPFAVYSFMRNSESFEKCIFCAVLHGGDRDTLGAMAGAISGAYLGIDAIPLVWKKKLENLDFIEKLAAELAESA